MRSSTTLPWALLGAACVLHNQVLDVPESGSWSQSTSTWSTPAPLDCSELPVYELDSLDCTQLTTAFESTVRASLSCRVPSDCQLLRPDCEMWGEVGCYYAANLCLEPARTESFHAAAEGCTGGYDSCDCDEQEPEVDCVNRTCVLINPS